MPKGVRSTVSIEQLAQTCEELYETHGFAKWSDVGRIHGISRQAVHNRIKQAEEEGQLPPGSRERWASSSSRRKLTADSKQLRVQQRLEIELTPENSVWLRKQCVLRGVTRADIVNGLLTRERLNDK
jgi:transposase-like protein